MNAPRARILVLDNVSPKGIDLLKAVPTFEVIVHGPMTPDELLKAIPEVDALIVRSQTKVNKAAIEAGKYAASLEAAFRIADVFNVPLADVFEWHASAPDSTTQG